MLTLTVLAVAIVGLAVGSFLNVVVWRLPRHMRLAVGRSKCPVCGHVVRAADNIPIVSWVLLRRRCRDCRAPIAVRYPLIEFLCGVTFALVAWRIGIHWDLPAYLYLAAVAIALAFIDLEHHRLPNALTLPSYVVGAVLLSLAALASHDPKRLVTAVIGMCAMYAFYLFLATVKPGGMGFGDVKLAGVLGLFLGFLGWSSLLVGAFLGFVLGGLGGIAILVFGHADRKSKIPFGPYMVGGALIAVLAGASIGHWYADALMSQ